MAQTDGPDRQRKPTLRDVAARASVSRSTASAALRGDDRVAETTRADVETAAEALGYVYNRSAAGLRTARTLTVGLVVDDLTDPFLAGLVAAVDQALGRHGRTAFLCNAARSAARQGRFIRTMREYNAEGLMIQAAPDTDAELVARTAAGGMPTIQLWSTVPGLSLDAVLSDDPAGVDLAVTHLAGLGHRAIAYVGGGALDGRVQLRLAAFQRALGEAGLPPAPAHRQMVGPLTREDGLLAFGELADIDPAVTAVLCHSDEVAFGVMLGIINAGGWPGRDLTVVGWNNVPEAALWYPSLTTIAHDVQAIAATAARLLIDRISGPEPRRRVVHQAPSLVVRRSCGPVRPA
jgi:LacI family transcriptional regulator